MEERFFTFIDCSIQDIFESTPQSDFGSFKDLIINSSFASPIADWFLSQNPCYPVRKVSLMPGMGILAPVQNMIHDGDLSTKKLPDLVGMISFNSIKYQTHASPPNKSMQQTANAAAD